eukprot:jgi/Tetstr1/453708/TSEL_040664.t1
MAESKAVLEGPLEEFCAGLRRRKIKGSTVTARRTAELLRLLIATRKHGSGQALIEDVKKYGARMQEAKPTEIAIGNMVRRVLSLIRDEAAQDREGEQEELASAPTTSQAAAAPSQEGALSKAFREVKSANLGLHNLLDVGPITPFLQSSAEATRAQMETSSIVSDTDYMSEFGGEGGRGKKKSNRSPQWKSKTNVIETLNELIDELDLIETQISMQGHEHIHANEVILTMNFSHTALKFFQEASKKRSFQVVVAEGTPQNDGHTMATELAKSGIKTTAITDSAIFAMMARVNKVIIGAKAVLANGGVIAPVGSHVVALAARRHAVPLVVLVGLHKLSPLFPHSPDISFNDLTSPASMVGFDVVAEGHSRGGTQDSNSVHICNPQYDYIPPELVTIFVTDTGGYTPSYVYRLLAEYYKREDYILMQELSFASAV